MSHSVSEAARFLRAARLGTPIAALPEALRPADTHAAYAIQRALLADQAIGGWKVGLGPHGSMLCAPMPAAGIVASPATLGRGRLRGIEAEVSFRLGADLPSRIAPYGREEVIAALETAHPSIEVLESAYADPDAVDQLSRLADLIMHGGFVFGPGVVGWRELDFGAMTVTQTINGAALQRTGNPAGDMIRLVVWLADEGARWAGGLRAGQIVTCGSWTGKTLAAPGARASVAFPGLGEASVAFAG
jgi:2-keto-4-pentenoate hydratase